MDTLADRVAALAATLGLAPGNPLFQDIGRMEALMGITPSGSLVALVDVLIAAVGMHTPRVSPGEPRQ